MKAQKITFILVLGFFLVALGYFGFQVWQKRYDYFFQGEDLKNIQEEDAPTENSPAPTVSPSPSPAPSADSEEKPMTEEEKIQDILDNHCSQNCRRKTEVTEHRYCLEICGLNQPVEVSKEEDCDKLASREKDICWKNLAIAKKSGSYCDRIEDKGIKESCQNRLIEEFLN